MQISTVQRHRLNRVVNFTQSNLSHTLDLDTLAGVAGLSKYHFARVFHENLGQTPMAFLSRMRLETAARSLTYVRGKSISDVAMDCGFSCSQTFSRAFRQYFHTSPSTFKSMNPWCVREAVSAQMPGTIYDHPSFEDQSEYWSHIDVRIENRPAYRVAYIRHFGPYFTPNGGIASTYTALKKWAAPQRLLCNNNAFIGLCPNNPALTPADYCIYDACICVPDTVLEDDVVSIQTIPAGTYAVLYAECSATRIKQGWQWLTSSWLPASVVTYELNPCYEYYPLKNSALFPGEKHAELCIRVTSN